MSDLSWGGPQDPQLNAEPFLAEVQEVPEGVRPVPPGEAEAAGPGCPACLWYHPRSTNGREIPCTFHVRPPEGECERFLLAPPAYLCRSCEHSRWHYLDRPPFCRVRCLGYDDGSCPSYEPRTPAESLPCPICGEPLGVSSGQAACNQGHSWNLRRSTQGCPRCGQRYGTFGVTHRWNRRVYHVCTNAECRWSAHRDRHVGPPRGRQRHGGQRVSPVTGRALGRTP
jgi:hypothetical protein